MPTLGRIGTLWTWHGSQSIYAVGAGWAQHALLPIRYLQLIGKIRKNMASKILLGQVVEATNRREDGWRRKYREAVLPRFAFDRVFGSDVGPIPEHWLHLIELNTSFHPRKGPNAGPRRRRRQRTRSTRSTRIHDLVDPDAITLGEAVERGSGVERESHLMGPTRRAVCLQVSLHSYLIYP